MTKITYICPICQKSFQRKPSSIISETPCCSYSCRAKFNFSGERIPAEQRFWSKVKIGTIDECWEWQGSKDRHGYGYLTVKGKVIKAHRFAFMLKYGQISSTDLVCHRCDNRLCCNYNHHFLGTANSNMIDRDIKNRQAKGEAIGNSKVSSFQVLSIRKLYETGKYTQMQLASQFGLTQSSIGKIINKKTWNHIN